LSSPPVSCFPIACCTSPALQSTRRKDAQEGNILRGVARVMVLLVREGVAWAVMLLFVARLGLACSNFFILLVPFFFRPVS
jgi:hypothetical protein